MAGKGVSVAGGVSASWLLIIALVVGAIWYKKRH